MKIIGKDTKATPCVATIGSFDGVHQGHQYLIGKVVSQARQRGLDSVVVTFPNPPLQVLRPDFVPQMLSIAEEKTELLQQTDIDKIALVTFTPALSQLSAFDFMQTVLHDQLQVRVLIIGYDNHFGHDRKGYKDIAEYGKALGIEVINADEDTDAHHKISSSSARQALTDGNLATANAILGRPYSMRGIVVHGHHVGTGLGFPTANIQVSPFKLIPENGVYLVSAEAEGSTHFGMLNIGYRPTLANGTERSIEVHIFDFSGDIYGKTITISILHHLRKEKEFANIEALKEQLKKDEEECKRIIPSYPQ